MLGQTKISKFFASPTPKTSKRSSEAAGLDSSSPKNKLQKSEGAPGNNNHGSLSPEQKERMEMKRLEALGKLASKQGPKYFGLTWKKALGAEFDKEYFVKVGGVDQRL